MLADCKSARTGVQICQNENTVGTVLFVLFLCFDLYGLTEEERKIVMGLNFKFKVY